MLRNVNKDSLKSKWLDLQSLHIRFKLLELLGKSDSLTVHQGLSSDGYLARIGKHYTVNQLSR